MRSPRTRKGISELQGAVMLIAIVLIAGAALFGYVDDEAAVNERAYGNAVGGSVNFLDEHFSVVNMAFPSSTQVEVWIYNTGQIALQLSQITLYDSSETQMNLAFPGATTSQGGTTSSSSGSFCVVNGAVQSVPSADLTTAPISLPSVSIVTGSLPTAIILQLPAGCTLSPLTTYNVNVLGLYGNDVVYYAEYDPPGS